MPGTFDASIYYSSEVRCETKYSGERFPNICELADKGSNQECKSIQAGHPHCGRDEGYSYLIKGNGKYNTPKDYKPKTVVIAALESRHHKQNRTRVEAKQHTSGSVFVYSLAVAAVALSALALVALKSRK